MSEKNNKVISVFSTKGGVGKSIIAANLAASIHEETKEKVIIVDLNLQFGDISFLFDSYSKRNLVNMINDLNNLNEDIIDEYLIEYSSGIKILPSPFSPEYADYITSESIEKILKLIMKKYSYIIIDLTPSFEEINLKVIDLSDIILFVTTSDLHTIKNISIGYRIMDNLEIENKVKLILNKYHKKYGLSKSDIEKSLKRKISYIIPEDDLTVIKSINEGYPFVISNKNSAISKSIIDITNKIILNKSNNNKIKSLLNRKVGNK